jgi:hypothetical protein
VYTRQPSHMPPSTKTTGGWPPNCPLAEDLCSALSCCDCSSAVLLLRLCSKHLAYNLARARLPEHHTHRCVVHHPLACRCGSRCHSSMWCWAPHSTSVNIQRCIHRCRQRGSPSVSCATDNPTQLIGGTRHSPSSSSSSQHPRPAAACCLSAADSAQQQLPIHQQQTQDR